VRQSMGRAMFCRFAAKLHRTRVARSWWSPRSMRLVMALCLWAENSAIRAMFCRHAAKLDRARVARSARIARSIVPFRHKALSTVSFFIIEVEPHLFCEVGPRIRVD